MTKTEIIKETAMEYIMMMQNGVEDEIISFDEYKEAVSFDSVYDYTLSEANKECKFLGGRVLASLINEVIGQYA